MTEQVESWLRTIEESCSPNTVSLYSNVLEQICGICGSPHDWSKSSVADYLAWCRRRGNTAATRNTKLQVLRAFIRDIDLDLSIPKSVPHPEPQPTVASEEAVEELSSKLKGKYLRGLLLMADAGLREAEVRSLKWNDIDDIIMVEGKGSKVRIVPITTKRLERVLSGSHNGDDYVVPGANGTMMTPSWLSRKLASTAEGLGLGRLTAHSFRHCFATRSAKRGIPVPAIQQALGHSSLATTEEYLKSLVGDRDFLNDAYSAFE